MKRERKVDRTTTKAGVPPERPAGSLRAWSGWDETPDEPPPARRWPAWACWVVSALLLFHITVVVVSELAGQVVISDLEARLGERFAWYSVFLHQDYAHAFFAPEPDPGVPVVIARLQFAGKEPDREIRIPDRATRPRIRYLRQVALAWHLTREFVPDESKVPRPLWIRSFAKHLCRSNPGCTRLELLVGYHRIPNLASVVQEASAGKRVDLEREDLYDVPQLIGVFSCDDF